MFNRLSHIVWGATILSMSSTVFSVNTNSSDETSKTDAVVIVTATRINNQQPSPASNITIIDASDIKNSTANTLPDLLALQAGVSTRSLFGNNASSSTVGLRGFGAADSNNTLILLDGRRLNDIDLAAIDFSAIPLDNIERIEIIRGGGSVLYGDGAVGGVINIITRSPDSSDQHQLDVQWGSYGSRKVSGALSQFGDDNIAVFVHANHFISDGYRENNELEQNNVSLDIRHYGDYSESYFKVSVDDQRSRLPGSRTVDSSVIPPVNQFKKDPRGTSTPNDFADQHGFNLSSGFVWVPNQAHQVILDIGLRQKEQQAFFDFGFGFSNYIDTELDSFSVTPRYQYQNGSVSVTAGVDVYLSDYESDRSQTENSAVIHAFDVEAESFAAYFQASHAMDDRSTIQYGARVQTIDYEAKDTFDPSAPGAFDSDAGFASNRFTEPSYELGLSHKISDSQNFYFRFNRAARFVTVDETLFSSFDPATFASTLSFDILEPQVSNGFEFGWRSDYGYLSVHTAVYYMRLKDEIHFDSASFANVNLDRTKRKGFEIQLSAELPQECSTDLNYTYQQAMFDDGMYDGNLIPLTSEHMASGTLLCAINDSIRFSAALNLVGSRYKDNDQANIAERSPSYTTLDLKWVVEHGRGTFSLALNNALDREFYDFAVVSTTNSQRFNAFPLPERNFVVTAGYRL